MREREPTMSVHLASPQVHRLTYSDTKCERVEFSFSSWQLIVRHDLAMEIFISYRHFAINQFCDINEFVPMRKKHLPDAFGPKTDIRSGLRRNAKAVIADSAFTYAVSPFQRRISSNFFCSSCVKERIFRAKAALRRRFVDDNPSNFSATPFSLAATATSSSPHCSGESLYTFESKFPHSDGIPRFPFSTADRKETVTPSFFAISRSNSPLSIRNFLKNLPNSVNPVFIQPLFSTEFHPAVTKNKNIVAQSGDLVNVKVE